MGEMMNVFSIRRHGLDADQSAALRQFVEDLAEVLAVANVSAEYFERTICGLAAAYHSALLTGKWEIVVAILTETLDQADDARPDADTSPAYLRLRAMIRENVDLLPSEMLRLA
jgi:hypothetical protein